MKVTVNSKKLLGAINHMLDSHGLPDQITITPNYISIQKRGVAVLCDLVGETDKMSVSKSIQVSQLINLRLILSVTGEQPVIIDEDLNIKIQL